MADGVCLLGCAIGSRKVSIEIGHGVSPTELRHCWSGRRRECGSGAKADGESAQSRLLDGQLSAAILEEGAVLAAYPRLCASKIC